MGNSIYTRNRRAYVTPVTTFGTAVAPGNGNAFRYIDLTCTPTQQESIRPDIQPSFDITIGTLGRRSTTYSGSCSLAAASGAGAAPDIGPIIKAALGKQTLVGGTSATYECDDTLLYVDLWQYVSPGTGDHEAACSSVVKTLEFEFGGDYALVRFSGEAGRYMTSQSFSSLDSTGKAGLVAFPTEPAAPVVNGAAISGYRGTITIDGNVYTIARTGKVTMDNGAELQKDGWGTDYPAAGAQSQRQVTFDISLYDDDSAALNSLKAKAVTGTSVDASFVLGAVAGGIYTFTLKNLLMSKPVYDNSGVKRVCTFNANKAHATSGTSKDALTIAIT